MLTENLFDKVSYLKDRFKSFFVHKKKVAALENYASCMPVRYLDELRLIKLCMASRFLTEKGAAFLEEILDEHQLVYLDWAHKTKWLKSQMAARKPKRTADPKQLMLFDLDSKRQSTPIDVPLELLAASQSRMAARV